MDTSYGPVCLHAGQRRKTVPATQAEQFWIYRTNMFFHRMARLDNIPGMDCPHDASMRSQRNTGPLRCLKTLVSARGNDFHQGCPHLQERSIVSRLCKCGMEGGIRHTRHPLLLQFSFLLLKDGFQTK